MINSYKIFLLLIVNKFYKSVLLTFTTLFRGSILYSIIMLFFIEGCTNPPKKDTMNSTPISTNKNIVSPEKQYIRFSGHKWKIKHGNGLMGPGPNYFSNSNKNVWIDKHGWLHLAIRRNNNRWTCSEVICQTPVGYGTYKFIIAPPKKKLAPNVIFGLFTWDTETYFKQANSEIDIEFTQWANTNNPNLFYSVQPTCGPDDPTGMYRERTSAFFISDTNHPAEYQFTWLPDKVTFFSQPTTSISAGNHTTDWIFSSNKPPRRSSCGDGISAPIGIPRPGTNTEVRINLWIMDANHDKKPDLPMNNDEQEVVIKSFDFTPLQVDK